MDTARPNKTAIRQPPAAQRRGRAIAAMVLGIVAVVSAPFAPTFTLVSILSGVVGLVLGLTALRGAPRQPATHRGRPQAIAGVVLCAMAVGSTIIVLAVVRVYTS